MNQLQALTQVANEFRDARDWRQFHNQKDLALSLSLEAAEVLEHFQWKNGSQIDEYLGGEGKSELKKELADVMIILLFMANDLGIDLDEAVRSKLVEAAKKYPVEYSKGVATKHTKIQAQIAEKNVV